MGMTEADKATQKGDDYDVVVVGAGFGGLYGVHRFRQMGLSVLAFEGGGGVGGVWYHNRYPGARVDVESYDYCYYFSDELYREWKWSEKYATQPEIMRYLNYVADRFDIRRHFRFNTWVTAAQWDPESGRYRITTSTGLQVTARFLVMATGQLSAARKPEFEGLDRFKGEWVQTSHWPEREVKVAGRRVAVIGTGSSGVQTIPEVAKVASQLYVFQRSPNFSVPAWNGPIDGSLWEKIKQDVAGEKKGLYVHPGCSHMQRGLRPATDFTREEQCELLETAWSRGGHGMGAIFSDQTVNKDTNDMVADFVRAKIRSIVKDPAVAEKLCPHDHPFGTRRLCVDTGYYATYNRGNVTLVDVREHPIRRITETGIELSDGSRYAVDLIIFALGFHAFTAPLSNAGIRNETGETPAERWKRGPRTLLGITTAGFPNLFFPTGPGSPSVLANMAPQNEFHIDWIADCMDFMRKHGYDTVEPTVEAETRWTAHVAEVSDKILRRQVNNYMVHINDDGSRIFIPYVGGMDRFARQANDIAANNYEGFRFGTLRGRARAA
jgi:cation diffusion facilitator CzcD-associated flavoprotein CzcO